MPFDDEVRLKPIDPKDLPPKQQKAAARILANKGKKTPKRPRSA